MPVSPIAYFTVFIVPALLPLSWWLGQQLSAPNLLTLLTPLVLYGAIPLADQLLGRDLRNVTIDDPRYDWHGLFRLITWLCLPIQLGIVLWGAQVLFVQQPFNAFGAIAWTLSVGYVGGIIAINVGHELIHKRTKIDQIIGGLLLSTVSYAGFKIEHVRGHHVWVSTPRDPSTARFNQSLYHFLPRAVANNFVNAWRLEAQRLRNAGLAPWHWRNELTGYYAFSGLLLLACCALGGWSGLLYFVGQSAAAFLGLEVINYVEHYGLERRQGDDGRYERPAPVHSWNASHKFTNLLLLQLGRHSDHHANATRAYPRLQHHDDVPQLPAGYPSMYLLALVPPLWRRVMNPKVLAWKARATS